MPETFFQHRLWSQRLDGLSAEDCTRLAHEVAQFDAAALRVRAAVDPSDEPANVFRPRPAGLP